MPHFGEDRQVRFFILVADNTERKRAEEGKAAAETVGPPAEPVGGSETILLCDDERMVRSSVTALLESVGYCVIAVESGTAALAAAESHDGPISLLLTDVTMPDPTNSCGGSGKCWTRLGRRAGDLADSAQG
ncbi:MAG: response regulator [Planctomycetes bacterium]|nr:response regulator [Planctomycetota bacterium]